MEENYNATSRNGHELKDMYNPETNTLDIRSNGLYPSNVLSNLCSNGFRFDGMTCSSMEGFLQSLKRKELDKQRQICSMKGGNARKMSVTSWQTDQIVWWKGQAINRQSPEYMILVREAYRAMFDQSERFRTALMQTRGMTLSHSTGEENPYKTILTPQEFCGILTELRDEYDRRIQALAEKPLVREADCNQTSDDAGKSFAISPAVLIDKKLVVRANNGTEAFEMTKQQLPQLTQGLALASMYEIENQEFEIKFSPLPDYDRTMDYTINLPLADIRWMRFYAEDALGNRCLIGDFNYVNQ
ncbi:MAG: hypothetical protein ACI308_09365 [Muribaculaceae bacterium]